MASMAAENTVMNSFEKRLFFVEGLGLFIKYTYVFEDGKSRVGRRRRLFCEWLRYCRGTPSINPELIYLNLKFVEKAARV
jgi:hypothetical protein